MRAFSPRRLMRPDSSSHPQFLLAPAGPSANGFGSRQLLQSRLRPRPSLRRFRRMPLNDGALLEALPRPSLSDQGSSEKIVGVVEVECVDACGCERA
jgi:hypothetical protein